MGERTENKSKEGRRIMSRNEQNSKKEGGFKSTKTQEGEGEKLAQD